MARTLQPAAGHDDELALDGALAGTEPTATTRRTRWSAPTLGVVAGLALVVWGLSIGLQALDDNSFFTHLATGRLILDEHGIPRVDPYSFTAPGHPFLVQSWLPSLLYAAVDRVAGGAGLVLLMGITCAALAALAWRLSRPAAGLFGRVLATAPVLIVGTAMWSERPLLLGLLFLGLAVLAAEDGLDPRWLLPVGWLWVNSHGSFPYGVLVLVLLAIGRRLDGGEWRVELRAAAWMVGGVLAGALSPLGPRLLLSPLAVGRKTEAFRMIIEWQAPRFDEPWQYAFLATLGLVVVALVRGRSWRLALPAIVFGALALTALRNLPVAGIVLVAPLAAGLQGVGSISDAARSRAARLGVAALAVVAVLLVVVSASRPAVRLDGYPMDALDFLEERGTLDDPARRLVTKEYIANLLELRMGRDARVFIDDRVDMYPLEVSLDYRELLSPGTDWQDVLDEHGTTTVLWPTDSPLGALLSQSPRWTVAWDDGGFLVADRA